MYCECLTIGCGRITLVEIVSSMDSGTCYVGSMLYILWKPGGGMKLSWLLTILLDMVGSESM
jgi:hypothetical protein